MTDHPISFRADMVRAIFDGRKTVTRRVLKPQSATLHDKTETVLKWRVGDRLWVREAWRVSRDLDPLSGKKIETQSILGRDEPVWDEADAARSTIPCAPPWAGRYRHARFMPRWASRLTLIVEDVRVERLHDITEEEAQAEGARPAFTRTSDPEWPVTSTPSYRWGFEELWRDINGRGAWEENPWVAAISFRPVFANIDTEAAR